MWFNSQNAALPRPRRRCDSVHLLQFCGVAQQQRCLRTATGKAALWWQSARTSHHFPEGIAQPVRADASHASGRRRESFCPHHFCPCGVVQSTCLPLMQEIPGAKPVRDANSYRPQSIVSDALPRYGSEPGAILGEGSISQSSQRSSGFHKPAGSGAAPETATTNCIVWSDSPP